MVAICRFLIGVGRAIVPLACRDDWTREWRAEIWHYTDGPSARGRRSFPADADLVLRCAGAVIHALWLRKEEWSATVILQDIRYGIRGLLGRPGFTAIAVSALALGIGANAAVFSVVNGVLLEPLPYRDPARLVHLWETNPNMNWTHATVAPANLLDWQARSRSFEGFAHYMGSDTRRPGTSSATLTGGGEPERVRAMPVSANFFDILGATPAIGRTFRPDEELAGRCYRQSPGPPRTAGRTRR